MLLATRILAGVGVFNNLFSKGAGTAGWIGIDRGARALKLAQLRRVGRGLELSAMTITPRWKGAAGVTDQGEQCRHEIETARTLGSKNRGHRAAAVTSMSLCTIATDDPPAGVAPTGVCIDQWQAGPNSSYSLSLPEAEVNDLCYGLGKAGLQCCVVDGLPLALARALALAPGYQPDGLVAALDWGAASATLVVAQGGLAVYARKLKQGAFGSLLDSLGSTLELSENEAEKVAIRYGVLNGKQSESDLVAKSVSEALAQAAFPLVDEVQSTFSHLEGKLKTRRPERLWVFGMGATVPGLPEWIGSKCNVQSDAWYPEGIDCADSISEAPACLFGPAIALSALAWSTKGASR